MRKLGEEETRFVEMMKNYERNNMSELSSLIDSVSNNTLLSAVQC